MKKKVIICLMVIGLLATCLCTCSDDDLTLPDIPGQEHGWGLY